MAFLAIVLAAIIATCIMESEYMERRARRSEINKLADNSRPRENRRSKYARVTMPILGRKPQ